mmetsp:Transcript_34096/g.89516  ORF Transcript_34096/g.89516 Transcript_34096/m.89516 type:complete len:402 (+) Transcript_34096:103-1308(+)|eukprot:CAMPEP_0182942414 /NCGR_PEP_ID=MMETSP0105_2-20130417/50610_1 /TAXON_ID=81532 ORGANISM="Acanthoeca-like sp., Strain 10tr" /NCGR_SAMPLE_ID=MMETSP0105_2 /ASSEMBLY_ACC=CAM_ASM_000205 /LENGTH=401 /DNA_ID=CAMNT_0025082139 /DNA_START=99 /DNA_END=1304 /DNA_ORIENTATION=+
MFRGSTPEPPPDIGHVNTNPYESPEMREHPDIDEVSMFLWFPGAAFVNDFLLHPPTPPMMERTLQILILIVALLMSALGGSALATEFDEMQAAMRRGALTNDTTWSFCDGLDLSEEQTTLGTTYRVYCQHVLRHKAGCARANRDFSGVTNGYFLSTSFGSECYGWEQKGLLNGGTEYLVEAINSLAFALFGLMFLYLSLVTTSFKSKTGKYSPAMMMSWWKLTVVPLVVDVSFMIWGAARFFQFLWVMMIIKYPNLVVEVSTGTGGAQDDSGWGLYNFSTEYGRWSAWGIPLMSIGSVVSLGYASTLKARTYVREKKALEEAVLRMDSRLLQLLEAAGVGDKAEVFCEAGICFNTLFALRHDKMVILAALKQLDLPMGSQLKILAGISMMGGGGMNGVEKI